MATLALALSTPVAFVQRSPGPSAIKSNTNTQVSTPTGIISHFVNLQVVVPEVFILGSGELHVDMGSTINLVCIIEKVSREVSLKVPTPVTPSLPCHRVLHHRSTYTGKRTIA